MPILLIWIYVAWVIVLLGAVITAYLPSLLSGLSRRVRAPGLQFQLALEALQHLDAVRATPRRGLTLMQLANVLAVDSLQLEPVLDTLTMMDWISPLDEGTSGQGARFVLLADADATALTPDQLAISETMLAFADVVFMSTEARLRCPFTELGAPTEAGSSYLFPKHRQFV